MGYKTIGEMLLDKRTKAGMTRVQVMDKTGIPEAILLRYEKDITYPRRDRLRVLCDIYGLTYEDVTERFPEPDKKLPVRTESHGSELAEMLKKARAKKELQQKEIAESIGVSSILISAWETGRIVPHKKYLLDIAVNYGIDKDSLLDMWSKYAAEQAKPYTDLAFKLRNARIEAKLTQNTASELIGLGCNVLSLYELGKQRPTDNILSIMADVYGDESLRPETEKDKYYYGQADFRAKLKALENEYPMNLIRSVFPEATIQTINIDAFEKVLSGMNDRTQVVLVKRYKYGMTLEQIGKDFNLTRERIRQIEANALQKLKQYREMAQSPLQEEINRMRQELLEIQTVAMSASEKLNEFVTFGLAENSVENISVDDLAFSYRTTNCLKKAGIKDLIGLTKCSENDLLQLKNFGYRSLNEVKGRMEALGVSLKG